MPPSTDLHFVKITKFQSEHTNECEPGTKQYTISRTRADEYAHMTLQILAQLASYIILQINGTADANYIHEIMKRVLPAIKAIKSQDIYNLCIWEMMLMKKIKSTGINISKFEFKHDVA